MMVKLGLVIGMAANLFYFAGYLMKKRNMIIAFNATSRVLYVLQYFVLGAFSGVGLEITGVTATLIAGKKNKPFVLKNLKYIVPCVVVMHLAVGLLLCDSVFGIFPIVGVILHTGSFFLDNEKYIRILSIFGQPCWLVYNYISQAYSSVLGDVIAIVSMAVAIFTYDVLPCIKARNKRG